MCFSEVYDFFIHEMQSWYMILNHCHLNLCRGNGVVYLTVLAPIS